MTRGDVVVDEVWKTFRIYQRRSSTLKQAMLRRRGDVFEEFWALQGVSFEVPAGSTLGLIGANGAGKSTMLKVLSRILVPDRGRVRVDGRVSALLELGSGFHPELSGRENVFLNGTILGMSEAELSRRFDEIVAFSGLEHAIDNAVKTYSSGMQARLGFAVAVAIEPDILIIDEVLAVGDEQFQRRCLERINELRSGGRTAIFVSHGLGQVQQICDTAVWLDKGLVAASGDTEHVISAYLRSVSDGVRVDGAGRERRGSGEIVVDASFAGGAVVDAGLSEVGPIRASSGLPLDVTFRWQVQERLDDLMLSFRLVAADGHVVAGAQLIDGILQRVDPGEGSAVYSISDLALLPGSYHLAVTVEGRHSGHVYDACSRLAHLDITPGAETSRCLGYVNLGGVWSERR
jgi:ABC-2 type transport system ATP-binding protein